MKKLHFDKTIFGFDVYRAEVMENFLPGLTYLILNEETPGHPAFDERVELERPVNKDNLSIFKSCVGDFMDIYGSMTDAGEPEYKKQIEELSIHCGKNSRFFREPRTAPNAGTLYRVWARNHLQTANTKYPEYRTYYVHDEYRIVAFLALQGNDIVLLSRLPEYRKQGLGHALISKAILGLCETNHKTVRVATQRRNTSALALYKSMGFKEVGSKFIYHIWRDKE